VCSVPHHRTGDRNPPRQVLDASAAGFLVFIRWANMAALELSVPYDTLAAYCRQNQIEYLALFGSAVRDELRPDSDVDLLMEFALRPESASWRWGGCSESSANSSSGRST
jgi:hypothetical protein